MPFIILFVCSVRSDQGAYTVLAKNCVGKDMVTVNLKVLDKPGPPEGPLKVKKYSMA